MKSILSSTVALVATLAAGVAGAQGIPNSVSPT